MFARRGLVGKAQHVGRVVAAAVTGGCSARPVAAVDDADVEFGPGVRSCRSGIAPTHCSNERSIGTPLRPASFFSRQAEWARQRSRRTALAAGGGLLSLHGRPPWLASRFLVGAHDALHQRMAHDVARGEEREADAVDVAQHLDRIAQARFHVRGRSVWVMSPVTTATEPKPMRVRNIFICSIVVFCASSRITNASFSVRPRM